MRRSLRLVLQAGAIALIAALLGLLIRETLAQGTGTNLLSDVEAGKRPAAPELDLPVIWPRAETWPASLRDAFADERVALRELRGYPVVINFWASWCDPCKEEAPILAASARAHAGDVVFLGLDVQDAKSAARGFLRTFEVNYVSVRDPTNDVYEAYGLTGVPETFYVDAKGRAVAHSLGQLSAPELEAGIAEIAGSR
jgi:cytochrome c biogenesis protein CcmG/thiol:disulfide interchange protein DsbE